MALEFNTAMRNARLDAIETYVGASAFFRLLSGAMPASVTTAQTGTLLVAGTLPSSGGGDWLAAASGGAKAKAGTWSFTATGGAGTAPGYFRILRNVLGTASLVAMQGLCTGAGSDMVPDSTSITAGQTVTVNTFVLTDGNVSP